MRPPSFYYRSQEEFDQYYFRLKQEPCLRCGRHGFLILHGSLPKSYTGKENNKKSRGKRIFCSNRNRRGGCGKTFSAIGSHILKRFILNSHDLWKFLINLSEGNTTKKEAFEKEKFPVRLSMAYRLWSKISFNQSRLRIKLSKKHPPPGKSSFKHPLFETIYHLKNTFPDSIDPIAAFQMTFQESFL